MKQRESTQTLYHQQHFVFSKQWNILMVITCKSRQPFSGYPQLHCHAFNSVAINVLSYLVLGTHFWALSTVKRPLFIPSLSVTIICDTVERTDINYIFPYDNNILSTKLHLLSHQNSLVHLIPTFQTIQVD